MQTSTVVLAAALDGEFNVGGQTYSVQLAFSDSTTSTPQTIDFITATGGSVSGSMAVGLTSSVFFAVVSGKTVVGVEVRRGSTLLLYESVPQESFASNGTYTINDIIVQIK